MSKRSGSSDNSSGGQHPASKRKALFTSKVEAKSSVSSHSAGDAEAENRKSNAAEKASTETEYDLVFPDDPRLRWWEREDIPPKVKEQLREFLSVIPKIEEEKAWASIRATLAISHNDDAGQDDDNTGYKPQDARGEPQVDAGVADGSADAAYKPQEAEVLNDFVDNEPPLLI